jgi:hypothetical protein
MWNVCMLREIELWLLVGTVYIVVYDMILISYLSRYCLYSCIWYDTHFVSKYLSSLSFFYNFDHSSYWKVLNSTYLFTFLIIFLIKRMIKVVIKRQQRQIFRHDDNMIHDDDMIWRDRLIKKRYRSIKKMPHAHTLSGGSYEVFAMMVQDDTACHLRLGDVANRGHWWARWCLRCLLLGSSTWVRDRHAAKTVSTVHSLRRSPWEETTYSFRSSMSLQQRLVSIRNQLN